MNRNQSNSDPTHERDPRWTAVDNYAISHLNPSDSPYYEALKYANNLSQAEGLDNIAVSTLQGKFLALQCRMLKVQHVLEVGTLGGYSAIWMASANPDISITTVEVEERHKRVAEQAMEHAGLSKRIEVLLGAGVDVLPKLRQQVEEGKREKFGFVFIDADKQNNVKYLKEAVLMCSPGACIIVDNVVRRGRVADEAAEEDPKIKGSRMVIEAAGEDARLDATILQTVGEKNYDGFMMCVVR